MKATKTPCTKSTVKYNVTNINTMNIKYNLSRYTVIGSRIIVRDSQLEPAQKFGAGPGASDGRRQAVP